jgi:hypothetical protein
LNEVKEVIAQATACETTSLYYASVIRSSGGIPFRAGAARFLALQLESGPKTNESCRWAKKGAIEELIRLPPPGMLLYPTHYA